MNYSAMTLAEYAKAIHLTAKQHGWHEEKKSDELWLCLVMTEIAEAVEADRKGHWADSDAFKVELREININDDEEFKCAYGKIIKGSVEEELADIVIRLLDFAYEKYGDSMEWERYYSQPPRLTKPFPENAWKLVKFKLWHTPYEILESVAYVYGMAKQKHIDLDQHILWKMRYNDCRDWKHGGKAY